MAITQHRLLNNLRFNRIVQTLSMTLTLDRPLIWLDRVNLVSADEDEIMARFTGRVYAADIIMDDQKAVVYDGWRLTPTTSAIPNLKHGQHFSQAMLNKLERFRRGVQVGGPNALLEWFSDLARPLVLGNRQRQNAMVCAMFLDDMDYDRYGVKMTNVSWGTPAALKATMSPLWTDATNGTPIANIETMAKTALDNYGLAYNRITSSTTDFMLAVATAEWRNRASAVWGQGFAASAGMLAIYSVEQMMSLFKTMKPGWEWILDDATFVEKTGDGTDVTRRVLPLGKVILDRSDDDRNDGVRDLANAVPTESIAADYIANAPSVGGAQNGPIGYFTGNPDLNPPNVTSWAVSRVWPRKTVVEQNAVLTVQ